MREKAAELKKEMLAGQQMIGGIIVMSAITPLDADFVKDIAFQLRAEVENSLVVIGSVAGGKPLLTAAASDSAVAAGINVGKNIREAAKLMQGGGGGQPHFATAGGKNLDGLHAAVTKLIELLTA
jgi:alanyl-tRNA synthetase